MRLVVSPCLSEAKSIRLKTLNTYNESRCQSTIFEAMNVKNEGEMSPDRNLGLTHSFLM